MHMFCYWTSDFDLLITFRFIALLEITLSVLSASYNSSIAVLASVWLELRCTHTRDFLDKNTSISLMALSGSDVWLVSFASKRKNHIRTLNCEMNKVSVIFSVHWAEILSVMTPLPAGVQITAVLL